MYFKCCNLDHVWIQSIPVTHMTCMFYMFPCFNTPEWINEEREKNLLKIRAQAEPQGLQISPLPHFYL